ncbi:MAG: polysaccharide biosynthesis/export family protein [Verrucomicrobiota bacterium]|jgi:polysaccharide export outer membrane protein
MKPISLYCRGGMILILALIASMSMPTGNLAAQSSGPRNTVGARKIQPHDIIAIRVVGEPDLTLERRIGPDGTISYPFLGVLSVEGKTTSELEKLLSGMLKPDYLFDPQVAVDFKQYVQETVSVTGEVNAPGPVEIPSDRKLDLHEAITRARDLKPTANPDLIQVTREGWDKPRMFKYKEILGVTDPSKRFYVEPNDKIWVAPRIF